MILCISVHQLVVTLWSSPFLAVSFGVLVFLRLLREAGFVKHFERGLTVYSVTVEDKANIN